MDQAKRVAGEKAAEFIQDGMIVGLGTGSTSAYFIEALIRKKLKIQAVASSHASAKMASGGGIIVRDLNEVSHVDITVDGADEIDAKKRMIKGGGGAHVREKILAAASKEMIVIVDETKVVPSLGRVKLPVEVLFYGSQMTKKHLEKLGYRGTFRHDPDGGLVITDNGNILFDIQFPSPLPSPEQEHQKILQIPGVVDTGFFFHLAGRVIIGRPDGTTTFL
jgi:ribose 5-phosphate isomerase A